MYGQPVTREEYLEDLRNLPFVNPTMETFARVAPHLTENEIAEVFNDDCSRVVVPPIFVHDAYQMVCYVKGWKDRYGRKYPPTLFWSCSGRSSAALCGGRSLKGPFSPHPYEDEAMNFAELCWGKYLNKDRWISSVKIVLLDPCNLGVLRRPAVKSEIYFVTNRSFIEIKADRTLPQSFLFEDSMVFETLDPLVGSEMNGVRGTRIVHNCAFCGAPITQNTGCTCCGHEFLADLPKYGWNSPLPPTIVNLLRVQKDYVFGQEPSLALSQEQQRFYASY